jgi:hypothetical protein
MLFKDWRLLDQTSVDLSLDKEYVYYLHARAWALKGWLGGTHSWITFWSAKHDKWLVVENSDIETIEVQSANILWIRENTGYYDRSPLICDRIPDAKWFGTIPIIVGKDKCSFDYDDIVRICENYPFFDFNLITRNCNTFISFIVSELDLNISRPIRSYGFKSKKFWRK